MARFTNQAQLRYGNSVTNSNIAVGEILEVLSATKTAIRDTYAPEDTITYVISLLNSGNTTISGLTLSDNLGAYAFGTSTLTPLTYVNDTITYYANGVLQAAPAVTEGPPLTISGISIPANGNAVLIYEVSVNAYAPLQTESEITNTVTIRGDGLISPIVAEETIAAEAAPFLSITKAITPVPVTENGTLTYTFDIQNRGNTSADEASNIVITDTFDPVLTNLTVSYNGTVLVENTDYTYNETTGEFATIAGKITVPAATFSQSPQDGTWTVTPGSGTLVITGSI